MQLIATKMQEQKIMLYQVIGEYYKGLIYEKNNKEQYKEHYQFVAENGNELYRAKKVREKINVNPKNKNTKIKTTGISILFGIILCISYFPAYFWKYIGGLAVIAIFSYGMLLV